MVISDTEEDKEIWLLELERGTSTPLTSYSGWDEHPVWAPDGRSIVFSSDRDGPPTLYRVSVEGGEPERLTQDFAFQFANGFSPDGRRLLFTHVSLDAGQQRPTPWEKPDLRMLDLDSGEVMPLLHTAAAEAFGRISPHGRWLAYQSDESGRNEVYLRSFPDLGNKTRVSLGGVGGRLHWDTESTTLYYGQGGDEGEFDLMAVEIATDSNPTIGTPRVVLSLPDTISGGDVAPDNQRVLVTEAVGQDEREIVVVIGWGQSMEKR